MFSCSVLGWFGFGMVPSNTKDIWFRPFKNQTYHASQGCFIYKTVQTNTTIRKQNKMAAIVQFLNGQKNGCISLGRLIYKEKRNFVYKTTQTSQSSVFEWSGLNRTTLDHPKTELVRCLSPHCTSSLELKLSDEPHVQYWNPNCISNIGLLSKMNAFKYLQQGSEYRPFEYRTF